MKRLFVKSVRTKIYISLIVLFSVLTVILAVFCFRNSYLRFFESLCDFGSSMKLYFCFLFDIDITSTATVDEFSKVLTLQILPEDLNGFSDFVGEYFRTFFDGGNFVSWLRHLLYNLSDFLLIFSMLLPVGIMLFYFIKKKFNTPNNNYNQDTKYLKFFKKRIQNPYNVVKRNIVDFFRYIKERKCIYVIWIIAWFFSFNFASIVMEVLAYYFYFIVEFSVFTMYKQIAKLVIDLSVYFGSIPLIFNIIIGLFLFNHWRKGIAYARLNHLENKNRGFINSRPIVTMLCGTMGKEKTTAVTDIVLSTCVIHRDKALEKLIENDMRFPNFPWINLEKILQKAMDKHIVYNLATTRQFIRRLKSCFYNYSIYDRQIQKSVLRHLRKDNLVGFAFIHSNFIFDYDYAKYGLLYDDKLKVDNIWKIIETYSQLYFIYVINSSFVLSNYSIRTDSTVSDKGNFPLWNNDFFTTDSTSIDDISKHSHILDFDALRLGKKVIENNPNANSFEFGVVAITEIGKERGNNLENQTIKKTDEFTNQKNDLFNDWIKMVRHSASVDHYPFVKVLTDEQRPTSWGADARELCDVVSIKERSDNKLALPFFDLEELLYTAVFSKFEKTYLKYRYIRSDNTLFMYLYKGVVSRIHNYYTRIYNQFGFHYLQVQTESGTQDGIIKESEYYIMNKKYIVNVFLPIVLVIILMKKR